MVPARQEGWQGALSCPVSKRLPAACSACAAAGIFQLRDSRGGCVRRPPVVLPQTVTKFRKGACSNCGAMTHKTKDCCERPRKKGAKWCVVPAAYQAAT